VTRKNALSITVADFYRDREILKTIKKRGSEFLIIPENYLTLLELSGSNLRFYYKEPIVNIRQLETTISRVNLLKKEWSTNSYLADVFAFDGENFASFLKHRMTAFLGRSLVNYEIIKGLLKNRQIKAPEKEIEKSEYDITHHFVRSNVNENVKQLYNKLHEEILKINPEIFRKFSRTAITYYSPEKMFIFIRLQKTSVKVDIYTNQQNLENVRNYTNHENWGTSTIFNEKDIENLMLSIRKSYEIMKQAVKDNINTGWFALTPREHLEEENEGDETPEEIES